MAYPSPTLSFVRRVGGALAAAAVTALLAHAATVLAFFTAAGGDPTTMESLNSFFVVDALIVFVFLSLVGALEGFARWYVALPAAAIVAAVASWLSVLVSLAGEGVSDQAAIGAYVSQSLTGPKLVFITAAAVAAATAGVAIWRLLARGRAAASGRRIALVRLPSSNLSEGQLTHIERLPVDEELADRQWERYVATLGEHGWEVVEVPAAEGFADSVFVEDTVVLFGDTAVVTNPGTPSRQGETDAVESTLRGLRLRVRHIEAPGTLEGGDVLKVGSTVYVGRSSRTNAEGIRQLRALLRPLGYEVVAVPVTKALHLKTAVTALPDGTVIGYPPLVDEPTLFGRFMAVPEAEGTAVVVLDDETLLLSAAAPKTAALLEDLGYDVVQVEISEFEKLEGCVTCLSVRVR